MVRPMPSLSAFLVYGEVDKVWWQAPSLDRRLTYVPKELRHLAPRHPAPRLWVLSSEQRNAGARGTPHLSYFLYRRLADKQEAPA